MVGLGDLPGGAFDSCGLRRQRRWLGCRRVQHLRLRHRSVPLDEPTAACERLWDVLLAHGVDPAADGWTELDVASGISADGNTIVGYGTRNGNTEAFVAVIPTIVPEPAAGALALLGVSSILLLRRRSLGRPNKVSLSKDEPCD